MHTDGDCHVDRLAPAEDPAELRDQKTVVLAVTGMGCPTCASRVHNALVLTSGVVDVDVRLEDGRVKVAFDPARTDGPELVAAVAAAGNDGRHHYRGVLVADAPH